MNTKNKEINIEYEGQSYPVDSTKIEGLNDEQILNMLSVGFPGMAGGKLERSEDGKSIKIIKRVGTKGNNDLLNLIEACPKDSLRAEVQSLHNKLNQTMTLAQWEDFREEPTELDQVLEARKVLIESTIARLSLCRTRHIPLV